MTSMRYAHQINHLVGVTPVEGRPDHLSLPLRCTGCGASSHARVIAAKQGLLAWLEGGLIQDALPDLSEDDRERLKTGICPKHWDEMFGG